MFSLGWFKALPKQGKKMTSFLWVWNECLPPLSFGPLLPFTCKVRNLDQNSYSFPGSSDNLRCLSQQLQTLVADCSTLWGKSMNRAWVGCGSFSLWRWIRVLQASLFDNPASSVPDMTNRCVWWWCRSSTISESSFRSGSTSWGESMVINCLALILM